MAYGLLLCIAGAACLIFADFGPGGLQGVSLVIAGAICVVCGGAIMVHSYGLTQSTYYDPTMPPGGLPTAAEKYTDCVTLASGVGIGIPKDPADRHGSDNDNTYIAGLPGQDLRTLCNTRTATKASEPGTSLPVRERLWEDSPAALAFDSLLIRALHAQRLPDLDSKQTDACPADRPSDAQVAEFLEGALGREALLPSVGTTVPLKVTCILVRRCTTLERRVTKEVQAALKEPPAKRALLHVEFICVRDGDVMGVHYEAQIACNPMAIVWFNRKGELPSADATSCTTLRRLSI